LNAPPAEPGSHSSPASTTPLPQSVLVVVVLVLELVVVEVDAPGCEELVVELEVLVGGPPHCSSVSFTRSLLMLSAKNAPRSCAPTVSSSFELGAQRMAVMWALREIRTEPPAKTRTSHASSDDVSGPSVLPFSSRMLPITLIVTGPRASSRALRPSFKLQKVYVPAVSTSVPGPCPPPAIMTAPYVPGPFTMGARTCPTVIGWPAGHCVGSGVVRPHALATSAMTGVVTPWVMRHDGASCPPLAWTSSHTDLGCSSTNGAMTLEEVDALSAFVAVMEMFAPTSPEKTSRPRALMLWSAKSTNEPVADCASALVATIVAKRARRAQQSVRRVMCSLFRCASPRPLR
jgi:hypothetical protein